MKKPDTIIILIVSFIVLTLSGIIIDSLDLYCYYKFLKSKGISIWSIQQFDVAVDYLKSYPGNILTIFGIAPWLDFLLYIYYELYKEKLCFWKKREQE